jgi:outer membrane protein OmpA-like peptidoglycan-associated protein
MTARPSARSGGRVGNRIRMTAALVAFASLAACDDIKSLDFRDELFRHSGQPVPGSGQPYPNLASVPAAAPKSTDKDTRQKIAQQLGAEAKGNAGASGADESEVGVPQAPPALPKGFVTAKQPMALPGAKTAVAAPAVDATGVAPAVEAPAAAEAAAPMAVPSSPRELAIVLFDQGSAEIDPAQADKLKPLVDMVVRAEGKLKLTGYATVDRQARDPAAAKLAALDLSLDRANAVAQLLIGLGAPPSILVVGADAPIERGATRPGHAADPRVEIIFEP